MTSSFVRALSLSLRLLSATCGAALASVVLLPAGCDARCDDYATELTLTREASQTTATLRSIAVDSTGRAVAVGDDGVLLLRDGAGVWQPQASGVTTDLHGVAAATDDSRMIAVGAGGVVSISYEGGTTWVAVATGVTADLHGVAFLDEARAVAVGDGVVLRSEDAGETWVSAEVPATAMLRAVGARRELDPTTGRDHVVELLAVGVGGAILRSPDLGVSWQEVAGTTEDLRAVGTEAQEEGRAWVVLGTQHLLRGVWATELESVDLEDELLGMSVDGAWRVGAAGAVRRAAQLEDASDGEGTTADDPEGARLLAVAGDAPGLAVGEGGVIVRIDRMSVKAGTHACDPSIVEGRPFVVDAEARTADPAMRDDWRLEVAVATLPAATRARLAAAWTRDGLYEHASIASFARFVLQLLAVGAPPELVLAGQAALADEVAHARACFGLASAYAGAAVGPGPLAIDGALAGPCDLAALAGATAMEGCVNETIAALVASTAAELAQDPAVRARLKVIAADERRHAALAWRTVAWALARGDARVRFAVAQAFAREPAPADDAGEDGLTSHGRLSRRARVAVARAAWREVIAPQAAALLRTGQAQHGSAARPWG